MREFLKALAHPRLSFRHLKDEYAWKTFAVLALVSIHNLVCVGMTNLIRQTLIVSEGGVAGGTFDPRVKIVIGLMESHTNEQFALDELARFVNLSTSRLRHIFTAEVGLTPQKYLRKRKLELAAGLLANSWLSVKQIVVRLGLQDRSHFERGFKNLYGVTPARYRVVHRYGVLEGRRELSHIGHSMSETATE